MLTFENTSVHGFPEAIRGMRNPKNSWLNSDSHGFDNWDCYEPIDPNEPDSGFGFAAEEGKYFYVGPNDYKLMETLSKAGTDHGKYLRFIQAYVDITGPLYWLKEMDTYRCGRADMDVEQNSCSTMHKITDKEFTIDDFSHEHLDECGMSILETTVKFLNEYRNDYVALPYKEDWYSIIQLLPSSYNQKRTYMFSYAALKAIYHARKDHKLDEWHQFCDWIKTLPYHKLITLED